MNWFEIFNEKMLFNDLILRIPFLIKEKEINNLYLNQLDLEITYSKASDINFMNMSLLSLLNDLSSGSKVNLQRTKAIAGKKVNKLKVRFTKKKLNYFLDFFLHMVIKGLKRRYILLRIGEINTGVLNFRFSNISELDLDDFFFFDLYEWNGSLNINLKMLIKSNININNLYNKLFINFFNLKNLLRNEVSFRKG